MNKNKELTEELVVHFKKNRKTLREQWIKQMKGKKFLKSLTPQEIETESGIIYDTCIDCLATGNYKKAEKYTKAMAERGVLQGMTTEQIIRGMLTLRDIYGGSLFDHYKNSCIKLNKALSVYEPVADMILSIVAMAFIKEKIKNLKEITAYTEKIIESIPDGITITSPAHRMIQVNKAMEELTGYKKNELIGKTLNKVTIKSDWGKNKDKINESFKKGFIKNHEIVLLTKDRTKIPVMINTRLIKDTKGNPVCIIPVIRDMRQTKKLISELKKTKTGLEQKVLERTGELQEKVKDLEKFNKFSVKRELKMIELKKEIKELKIKTARLERKVK